ncbi:MAG: phospholipid transport system substrate-binding protein [Zhongshania aliphaticivorans]|jgi:phospholipid transport system substrate-binding protein
MNARMEFKILIVCAAFFMLGVPAYSQEGESAKLEAATKDALDVLYKAEYKDYTDEEKAAVVRSVLERDYDLMVIIRRTLSRNWKLLSPSEQVEVKELVTRLIVKAFVEGIQGFGRPTIECGELIMITDKRCEVPSVITFPDGDVFNVVYRFGRLKTGWQIYDIVAEGVSVVSNYRQQFDDHFRKGSGAELIEKLEKLLEEGYIDETTKL